jgi:hypothetical protein
MFLGLYSYLLQVDKSFGLDMMHHLRWFVLFDLHMRVQK